MQTAELLLALLVIVAALVTVSRRIRVPYPVLLLLGGLVVGLVPGIPRFELDPQIIFLVVLPPLLYVSAFLTPIRDFKTNLKNIASLAVGLVAASAGVVAAVAPAAVSVLGSLASFVFVALGGILIGLVVGWIAVWVRTRIDDTPVEVTISLLTPYAAYLPAEALGVSGVLAAVTAGLFIGRRSSQIMGSEARLAGRATWESLVFLLNGIVFLSIGFQIASISRQMDRTTLLQLAAVGILVSIALIAVRALWVIGMSVRELLSDDQRRTRLRESVVLSWAGMRGVVSLAAALALPVSLPGSTLPARDAIIVITFTVILVTLVGQGLTLPLVIRALGLGSDDDEGHEESHARQELIGQALERIGELEKKWPDHKPLIDQLRTSYAHRAEHEEQLHEAPGNEAEQELVEHRQIRSDVIDAQRDALRAMRDRGAIDDELLRNIEREPDLEEIRMEA